MEIQLVRNATLWLAYGGLRFLVDPMLADSGAYPAFPNTPNDRRNPLVPLPGPVEQWLAPDAVIVTHLHNDHWDGTAKERLSSSVPVICQPGDDEQISADGFTNVTAISEGLDQKGIMLNRTSGQHGTGEIGKLMGNVSGFVLRAAGEPTLYIAGDTIWCDDVREAIDAYRPDVIIVNAGGARFTYGDPITMDDRDIASLCRYAPEAQVVAVHMDAINHCLVTKADLEHRLKELQLAGQVRIPSDGETIAY
ncbi:MBL fold metallo-hydrolase [Paenibacillus hodogayensis]|uniref:MBL fold metallo-hydrolase n=1 Tax=Paenibacillus hodogayensis TaxID=279208 RepID=A0ABV5W6J6_9BACL